MTSSLYRDLLDLGSRMLRALDEGDNDTFLELLSDRGTLLDALSEYPHPSDIEADWKDAAEALSLQNEALIEAVGAQCTRMQDALTRMEQVREARRSYHQPKGRRNILSEDLRV